MALSILTKTKPSPLRLEPPEDPLSTLPSRTRYFVRPERAEPHDQNFNYIVDGRIRVTPIEPWHWDDRLRMWVGYGERWNRFSRTWSEPMLFHCLEFECEGNTMSQV